MVGVYCKPKRDTVPVLYVKTDKHGVDSKKTAEDALKNVFVTNAEVEDTNLPHQVVIVEFLPHTPAGKVDTRQILKNPLAGLRLDIEAERSGGKLTGLHFKPGTAVELDRAGIQRAVHIDRAGVGDRVGVGIQFAAVRDRDRGGVGDRA